MIDTNLNISYYKKFMINYFDDSVVYDECYVQKQGDYLLLWEKSTSQTTEIYIYDIKDIKSIVFE